MKFVTPSLCARVAKERGLEMGRKRRTKSVLIAEASAEGRASI